MTVIEFDYPGTRDVDWSSKLTAFTCVYLSEYYFSMLVVLVTAQMFGK